MSEIKTLSYLAEKYKADPTIVQLATPDFQGAKLNAPEILTTPDSLSSVVIDPILESGGLMQIFGERGVGKSYFTFSLACALATGGTFLKFKVPYPQKVAYFDGEMGHLKLKPYIQQTGTNPTNLDIISCSRFVGGTHPALEKFPNEVYQFLTDNHYDGIIIDNIATCTDLNENEPEAWKPLIRLFVRLRNAGMFVIFVAHSGRNDKTRARGASNSEDVLNTIISIQRSDEILTDAEKLVISFPKHRNFSFDDANPFNAIRHKAGSWEVEDIKVSTYQQVINWFLVGASGVHIAKQLNITPQMVSTYKKRAVSEGLLKTGTNGRIINLE